MNKKTAAIVIIVVLVIFSLGVLRLLNIQKRNKLQQQYESEILMEDENNQFSGENEQENPYLNDNGIIGDNHQQENLEEENELQELQQSPEEINSSLSESEDKQLEPSVTTPIEDQVLSDIDPNYNIIKPVGVIKPYAKNILDVEKYNKENHVPDKVDLPKETIETDKEKPAFEEVPENGQSQSENLNSVNTSGEEEIIFTTPDPQEVLKKEQEALNNKIESNWKIRKKEDKEGE